jgi:DNA-binding response OmpR family regulator
MASTVRVAVVDDERPITDPIAFSLRKAGYEVEVHHDGESALAAFLERAPQLVVLDIMMPRMDGLHLCRRLRSDGITVPILFLSSRDEEIDRLLGFEMGGDDYLSKPFSMRELLARVKALLRRTGGTDALQQWPGASASPLTVGAVQIDADAAVCRCDGVAVPLTLTELRILSCLAADPGVIKSRSQLMVAAFPEDLYSNDRAADSHIKRLRRKLETLGLAPDRIESIYGMGYRLRPEGEHR